MAFLNDIGKKIASFGQSVNNTPVTPEARLNSIIAAEESKLNAIYCSIGKLYAANCNEPTGDFVPLFEAEKVSLSVIENAKKEIEALKSASICPNCGTTMASDAQFCYICGLSIANITHVVNTNVCSVCGNRVQAGMRFCTVCGNAVVQQAPLAHVQPSVTVPTITPVVPVVSAEPIVSDESAVPPERKCQNCGKVAEDGIKFCTECGTKLETSYFFCETVEEAIQTEIQSEPVIDVPQAEIQSEMIIENSQPEIQFESADEVKEEIADISGNIPSEKICSLCGSAVEDEVLFCTNCGNSLANTESVESIPESVEEPNQTCSKCGMSVDAGMKFCPYCGSTMGEDEIQEPIDINSFENQPHNIPLNPITDTRAFVIQHPIAPANNCCPTCGATTEPDDIFCILCGTRL